MWLSGRLDCVLGIVSCVVDARVVKLERRKTGDVPVLAFVIVSVAQARP